MLGSVWYDEDWKWEYSEPLDIYSDKLSLSNREVRFEIDRFSLDYCVVRKRCAFCSIGRCVSRRVRNLPEFTGHLPEF